MLSGGLILLVIVATGVNGKVQYGQKIKEKFLIDQNLLYLNHGSRGAVPRIVFNEQLQLMREMESNPSNWFRTKAEKKYNETVSAAAEFVNSKEENLVIVDNLSTGLETVLDSLRFEEDDAILIADQTYRGIVKKQSKWSKIWEHRLW